MKRPASCVESFEPPSPPANAETGQTLQVGWCFAVTTTQIMEAGKDFVEIRGPITAGE